MELKLTKEWLRGEDVLGSDGYRYVDIGVIYVKTEEIIALSLWPPEKVATDEKMVRLIDKVKREGWNDPFPQTINLYKIPNGKYIVGEGGNHRPMLASELGISEILANVCIVIPEDFIPLDANREIVSIETKIRALVELAHNKRDLLWSLEDDKNVDEDSCKQVEREYNGVCKRIDNCHDDIDLILRNIAVEQKLLSDRYASPKVNIRFGSSYFK